MFLNEYDESPILGNSQRLSDEGVEKLGLLVENSPLAVFQAMNKKFNEKGLLTRIEHLTE